ncbi:MAG: chemotaxis protein [Gammaproteobacteria bacterium]|nr:chemotaxis protein [Gammaproteobacteria bacterium]
MRKDKSMETDNKSHRTRYLMGLSVISLVLVVINLVLVNIHTAEDQIYIQQTSDLRVLSQEIARNASAALGGSAEAFVELEESTADFDQAWSLINNGAEAHIDFGMGVVRALPAKADEINREQADINPLWNRVTTNVGQIIANRDNILGVHALALETSQFMPELQRYYEEVVNALLDDNASLSTIAVAQRQAWLAERIALNLNRIVSGDFAAGNTVEQFQRDIVLFSNNHEALLEGDPALGITRIADAEARNYLIQVSELFAALDQQAGNIVSAAEEIFASGQAVSAIVEDSERLLSSMTALSEYFILASDNHLASPALGYVLLLIMFLLIAMYGLEMIRQSRKAEKYSATINKRNNSAVLNLLEEISGLAEGDLTVKATVRKDFTGAIADSINYAIEQLRGLVKAITNVTMQVSESTKSSVRTAKYLSDASQKQIENISSVSESVREMEKNINRVSNNAMKSLDVAKNSVKIASGGALAVKNTIHGMDTIRGQIQETSKNIKRLGESSQEIGGFVSLINDIADHTNTLSLNAAIQAAMAGDAGKGFAVVADEVHALAERSTDATRKIESLVKVIQRDINDAVSSMEQTTAEVVQGTQLAQGAGAALDDIEKVSKELAALVEEISLAAQNQSKNAAEITSSMETIEGITTETSKVTETTSEFIMNLGLLTERLQKAVAGFSLDKTVPQQPAATSTDNSEMNNEIAAKREVLEKEKSRQGPRQKFNMEIIDVAM